MALVEDPEGTPSSRLDLPIERHSAASSCMASDGKRERSYWVITVEAKLSGKVSDNRLENEGKCWDHGDGSRLATG